MPRTPGKKTARPIVSRKRAAPTAVREKVSTRTLPSAKPRAIAKRASPRISADAATPVVLEGVVKVIVGGSDGSAAVTAMVVVLMQSSGEKVSVFCSKKETTGFGSIRMRDSVRIDARRNTDKLGKNEQLSIAPWVGTRYARVRS